MKKQTSLIFLAVTAVVSSLLTGGLFLAKSPLFATNQTGESGCASITFSTSTSATDGTAIADLSGDYTTTGLPSVTFSSLVKLFTHTDASLKMSSGSGSGSFTVTFASAVSIAQVSVDAKYYSSSETASLAFTSSDSGFNGSATISSSSAANFDLYSTFATSYSVTSLTFTATKRLYLSDIRFYVTSGGSGTTSATSQAQSSSSTSIASSSTSSSSSVSSPVSSSTSTSSSAVRIAPVKSSDGSTLSIYNVDGTVNRTLKKSTTSDSSTWYVDYEDVALYYQGFGTLPANYHYGTDSSDKSEAYAAFGTKARLYTADYTSSTGYMSAFPTPNEYRYFEADIGGTSSYAASSSWNRGTYRLVLVYKGFQQYNSTDTVIFYTTDHYASFKECYNYANGWSGIFDGETSGYGTYVTPTTITLPTA